MKAAIHSIKIARWGGLAVLAFLSLVACTNYEEELNDSSVVSSEVEAAPFQWTRAEDVETRALFLRNFGVGYSYDAVRGNYCDWSDIRSQVLNAHFIEELEEQLGERLVFLTTSKYITVSQKFEYSLRDYVASLNMASEEEIDIGLYNKEKRKRQYFIEDGVQETFYYLFEERNVLAHRYIGYSSLIDRYRQQPDIYTLSFRNAVAHLAATADDNVAAVDSFVNVWGTHVIVDAELGGSLNIDLLNSLWRYRDEGSDEEITTEEFLKAVQENATHASSDDYAWLEQSHLNIAARGGDQSTLTSLLGEHAPDGTRTFSTDGVALWRASLHYAPDDEAASNVEMVSMRVVPIWEFVEPIDHFVALRLQAVILQDVALQQKLFGDWNFFDVSLPMRYATATCQYHDGSGWTRYSRTDDSDSPMVVNIESGGRYVATVCHESFDGIDMWVCYPIYEGKVKLACGLGVADDQSTYKVKWLQGKVTVTPTGETADGTAFYITAGGVGVKQIDGAQYAEGHAMPYVEAAGGIQPDGTYSTRVYPVSKEGEAFYIATADQVTNFVNFAAGTDGRYYRTDEFNYIYNPNEIRYE